MSSRAAELRGRRAIASTASCSPLLAAALLFATATASAQTIAERVAAVRDGHVILSYETRPDVCGTDDDGFHFNGNCVVTGRWISGRECFHGPAWVTLTRSAGRTTALHLRIGRPPARSQDDVDLGAVEPDDAAHFLIDVAHTLGESDGNRALAGAAVADAPAMGPQFLALAEAGDSVSVELRKHALFWAGQSDLSLEQIVGAYPRLRESELRTHYTFVLSQRREPEATNDLIDVVRHDGDRDVRRQAMFWLGQRKDSTARQFLLELLLR